MASSLPVYDAVVIGNGIAGFAAACALSEKGKRVAVIHRGTGATSLSSGAWDFGPVTSESSLEELLKSSNWRSVFKNLKVDVPLPPASESVKNSFEKTAQALAETLPLSARWEKPYALLSTSGGIRRTFAAQSTQTALELTSGKKYAFAASPRWRIRGDWLCRLWNERIRASGGNAEIRSLDLPVEMEGWDIPLATVSSGLRQEPLLGKLTEALSKLGESVDGIFLPPIFPTSSSFEKSRQAIKGPLAECLASVEPTAGYRLHEAIRQSLSRQGVSTFHVQQIKVPATAGQLRELTVLFPNEQGWASLRAEIYVLASGRFFGGGLSSGYRQSGETLFALPISEGDKKKSVVVSEGLFLDSQFRPLAEDGKPAFQNLFACGSVLGGLDFSANQVGLGFFAFTGRECVASAI